MGRLRSHRTVATELGLNLNELRILVQLLLGMRGRGERPRLRSHRAGRSRFMDDDLHANVADIAEQFLKGKARYEYDAFDVDFQDTREYKS